MSPVSTGRSRTSARRRRCGRTRPRAGHLQLDWSVVLPFTVVAVVGALIGKLVADRQSPAALIRAFAVMLVAIGAFIGIEILTSIGGARAAPARPDITGSAARSRVHIRYQPLRMRRPATTARQLVLVHCGRS